MNDPKKNWKQHAALLTGGAGLLAAPAADGGVVSRVLNERIDPDTPDLSTSTQRNSSSDRQDDFELDLDGVGGADVRVTGRTAFEHNKVSDERYASSSLQLTSLQAGTAIELVQDADFGNTWHSERLGVGDVVGPGRDFYALPSQLAEDFEPWDHETLLVHQNFEDNRFPSIRGDHAAFSVFHGEADDLDGDGLADGPLFIGFRLDAGGGSHRHGFLQFDDVDSDGAGYDDWKTTLDTAGTLVGYGIQMTPDTAITTFDVIPEPGTLALLGAGGACLLVRRRAA